MALRFASCPGQALNDKAGREQGKKQGAGCGVVCISFKSRKGGFLWGISAKSKFFFRNF